MMSLETTEAVQRAEGETLMKPTETVQKGDEEKSFVNLPHGG